MNTEEPQSTEAQPDSDESKVVEQWLKKIEATRKFDKDFYDSVKTSRRLAKGYKDGDGDGDEKYTVNLFHSQFKSLIPHIYAKNPEIMVEPAHMIEEETYEALGVFMETMEIVVNKELAEAGLKKRAKKNVQATMTCAIGWVKASYQRTMGEDPLIVSRLQDTQDNVARIKSLIETLEGDEKFDTEQEAAELDRQIIGLKAGAEITLNQGMVLDRVKTDDITIDPDINEMGDYLDAKWISHDILMTADRAKDEYKLTDKDIEKCVKYSSKGSKTDAADDTLFVMAHEIWERTSQTCFTTIEGLKKFAREPYAPPKQGERWYPFFGLIFNDVDGERWPLSDIELAEKIVESYNDTRDKFNLHRERSIPGLYGRKSDFTDGDGNALALKVIGELTLLDGPADDSVPLQNSIAVSPYAPIDSALYDQSRDLHDLSLIFGNPDANQGQLSNEKTLGEAEILREGLNTRTAERRDIVEEWLTEIAQFTAEVLLQELDQNVVTEIAGQGAMWPELTKEKIYRLVEVSIKAGSTGKPNHRKEQDQWMQFMPVIQEMMGKVLEYRMNGMEAQAQGLIDLLKEGVKRFDERMDVEKFFPPLQAQTVDPMAAITQQQLPPQQGVPPNV